MFDCEQRSVTKSGRVQLRIGGAVRNFLTPAARLAAACMLVSACAPLLDNAAPPGKTSQIDVAAPSPGRSYADAACAACHAVAAGDPRSPNPKAPTFEEIANVPGMTLMALNVALHTSHKTMPNLIIEPDRIEDLSAYLHTLKR